MQTLTLFAMSRTALPFLAFAFFVACDDSPRPPPPTPTAPTLPVDAGGTATTTCPIPTGVGTPHQGFLEASETWTAAASPHHITAAFSVRAAATLTIEKCAVVTIDPDTTFSVEGKLVAEDALFKAAQEGTAWGKLEIAATGNADLSGVTLSDGGSAGDGTIFARGLAGGTNSGEPTKNLKVAKVTIQKSRSYGVNLDGWAAFADGSGGLTIVDGGSDAAPSAIRIEAGIAATLPSPLEATGNKKNDILVKSSKTFMRNDTFVARGIPYRALGPIYVSPAADGAPVTLTIERGVTIGFEDAAGSGMRVGSSEARQGILVAAGTESAPIVFTSAKEAPQKGDWTNIEFHATPISGNTISFAKVEYAGAESGTKGFGCGPAENNAAIVVMGLGGEQKGPAASFIAHTNFDHIAGTTVIVSGWVSDFGPSLLDTNTFGADVPACHVSNPRRTGAGDVCDGGRTTCL